MSLYATVTSTAGSSASITLSADPSKRYYIESLAFSYSTITLITSGTLSITSAGNTIFSLNILSGDAFVIPFEISAPAFNETMVITLSGILSVSGKLNIKYRDS